MKKSTIIILLLFIGFTLVGQEDNKAKAIKKAREAIALMDEGDYDTSIAMLSECKKMDPDNYVFSYEIGLAYVYKQDYSSAIKELKKTVKYKKINSQIYQLLGNSYSLSGKKKKALKEYQKGLNKFKDAGNLYLEIGNVYLQSGEYDRAIENYEKGISVNPPYPSNYYRLTKLFLSSSNKVPGLIYGEIFMNLERTTERTKEVSELLYKTYRESMNLSKDSSSIDFCQIVMVTDPSLIEKGEIKLPYCAIFGKSFILSIIAQENFSLESLSEIREQFISFYYSTDAEEYPVILFDYHKAMIEAGVFEAYNYYLFQISNPEVFDEWMSANEGKFEKFIEWYTTEENLLNVTTINKYIRF